MEQIVRPKNYTPLRDSILKQAMRKKRNLLQVLVELDIFSHIVLFIAIIILVVYYVLTKQKNESTQQLSLKNSSATNSAQAVVAAPPLSTNNSLYINQQLVAVDKKYFIIPEKFILTLRGPIKKETFGYLPYWMVENLDSIDIRTITTLSYFGLEVNADGQIANGVQKDSFDPYYIWQNDIRLKNYLDRARKNKTKIFLTFKSFN
ncbi:hypothetical protein HY357_00585, partial [Candidatus Roizmanbacteria bacterium]|nr:hypothetical protein [Candidatus Roizmanbacteria bacterium]